MTQMPHNALQQEYLQAIGIQTWQPKNSTLADEPGDEQVQEASELTQADKFNSVLPIITIEELDISQKHKVPVESKHISVKPVEQETALPPVEFKAADKTGGSVSALESEIAFQEPTPLESDCQALDARLLQNITQCQRCASRSMRLNSLPGQGYSGASVFFISDAPGIEEDRSGHYLSDSGRQLFQTMLATIGIDSQYYYTGLVKCHSLQEFLLSDADIQQCSTFLTEQIRQINPRLIVILGVNPARALLKTRQTFRQLRGQLHSLNLDNTAYPALVSFHPDYLLRNPSDKKQALADLLLIKQYLQDNPELPL